MEKREKLQQLIDYYTNGNKRQFALMIGTSPQNVSTWLSRNTFDSELILAKCEHLNAQWLLTDQGDMLNVGAPAQTKKEPVNEPDYKSIINELLSVISVQSEQLERASRDLLSVISVQSEQLERASHDLNRALDTINNLSKNRKSPTTRYMVAEDSPEDDEL